VRWTPHVQVSVLHKASVRCSPGHSVWKWPHCPTKQLGPCLPGTGGSLRPGQSLQPLREGTGPNTKPLALTGQRPELRQDSMGLLSDRPFRGSQKAGHVGKSGWQRAGSSRTPGSKRAGWWTGSPCSVPQDDSLGSTGAAPSLDPSLQPRPTLLSLGVTTRY
jgi:hypothetical protein